MASTSKILPIRYSIRLFYIMLVYFSMSSFYQPQQSGEWKAPKEADQLKNPLQGNNEATLEGKKLYANMCSICHGAKGKGDGVASMNLKPRPANLTSDKVQAQSDGAIYWKISEGRPPMAPYKSTLTEEQRWQLVNSIRQLAQ